MRKPLINPNLFGLQAAFAAGSVLRGLAHLHRRNIVHRDVPWLTKHVWLQRLRMLRFLLLFFFRVSEGTSPESSGEARHPSAEVKDSNIMVTDGGRRVVLCDLDPWLQAGRVERVANTWTQYVGV